MRYILCLFLIKCLIIYKENLIKVFLRKECIILYLVFVMNNKIIVNVVIENLG